MLYVGCCTLLCFGSYICCSSNTAVFGSCGRCMYVRTHVYDICRACIKKLPSCSCCLLTRREREKERDVLVFAVADAVCLCRLFFCVSFFCVFYPSFFQKYYRTAVQYFSLVPLASNNYRGRLSGAAGTTATYMV